MTISAADHPDVINEDGKGSGTGMYETSFYRGDAETYSTNTLERNVTITIAENA